MARRGSVLNIWGACSLKLSQDRLHNGGEKGGKGGKGVGKCQPISPNREELVRIKSNEVRGRENLHFSG